MLDILGTMTLTALAVVFAGILASAGARAGLSRGGPALLGGAWFATIAGLGAFGIFQRTPLGTPAIGMAVLLPLLLAVVVYARSRTARSFVLAIPLATWIGLHVGRLFGAAFLILHADGRLPPTFALTAGWGDIFIAAAAVPVALAAHRRAAGWRTLVLVWNSLGALDLVTAVTLGVGSAQNSPVRFIFEAPDARVLATLPWVMVPGFFVPLYLLSHAAIFVGLRRAARCRGNVLGPPRLGALVAP